MISLDEEEKRWLDEESDRRGVSMAQVIRDALQVLRARAVPHAPTFERLLVDTRGTWTEEDGLAYQTRMRDAW